MEKADILEMTVAYLRATHCRRRSGLDVTSLGAGGVDRYAAGFRECAVHVGQYLLDAGVNFDAVHERLMSHLEKALQTVVDVDDCGRLPGGDVVTRWMGDCDTTGRCSPDTDDNDESRSVSETVTKVVDDVVRWQYAETALSADVQLLTTTTTTTACRQLLQPGSDADSPRSADEFPSFPPCTTSDNHPSSLPFDVINDATVVVSYDVTPRVTSSDTNADDVWRPW